MVALGLLEPGAIQDEFRGQAWTVGQFLREGFPSSSSLSNIRRRLPRRFSKIHLWASTSLWKPGTTLSTDSPSDTRTSKVELSRGAPS